MADQQEWTPERLRALDRAVAEARGEERVGACPKCRAFYKVPGEGVLCPNCTKRRKLAALSIGCAMLGLPLVIVGALAVSEHYGIGVIAVGVWFMVAGALILWGQS